MGTKVVSAAGAGAMVKVRYLGDAEEPQLFVGAATRAEYWFGGRVNLGDVDVRDLATGQSYAPGLFEQRGPKGERLFELHVTRRRKREPEPEPPAAGPDEPQEESDAEGPVPGDHD